MPVSIVTLTRFPEIFAALAESVNVHEPCGFPYRLDGFPDSYHQQIVVTSGGVEPATRWPLSQWRTMVGPEPFCYARNANIGIAAAGRDDVLLTNDDVQWTAPMLAQLEVLCAQNPLIGVLSPQIIGDGINNELARASTRLPGWCVESAAYVPFVCVYLPRRVVDAVGQLDESFTDYGGDDQDFCARAQKAGFKLAVTPLAKVIHGFGGHRYSSSFLRVMTAEQRERSCQESMARISQLHA